MLEPGMILGAKYRLDAEIGRGGMGFVWRATRLDLGTELALKVMYGEALNKPGGLDRFSREAKAAASLTSPHVVRIIDFGADTGGNLAFMAMELLEGESLSARLAARTLLTPERVAAYITQVARALAQAHAAGIVHRDLKPANIFLVQNGDDEMVKLLDFGIAKAADGLPTATGSVLGTPYYMSPEQVNCSKDIDHRTDLWSLGVIACECLTGRRPFAAETLSELAMKIALGRAELPSSLGAVPKGFDEWFARATEVDRTRRFQSATELASTLARLAGHGYGAHVPAPAAELGLAATLASAAATTSESLELGPSLETPRASITLGTGVSDAASDSKLSTTSSGSTTMPSRPAAGRPPRAWRRAALGAALALVGATYLAVFAKREQLVTETASPPADARVEEGAHQGQAAGGRAEPPSGATIAASPTPPSEAQQSAPASPETPPAAREGVAAETELTEKESEKTQPSPPLEATVAPERKRPPKLPGGSAARKAVPAAARAARPQSTPAKAGDALDAYDLQ